MTRALAIVLACLGCRGGPTAVRYAGPAVGQCSSGRAYTPPPLTAQATPFVAEPAAEPATEPVVEPPATEPGDAAKQPKQPKKQKRAGSR